MKTARKSAEALVLISYHCYMNIFRKSNTQCVHPSRNYNFEVALTPGAQPQASILIPLSPTEDEACDKMIVQGHTQGIIPLFPFRSPMNLWEHSRLAKGQQLAGAPCCNPVFVQNKYSSVLFGLKFWLCHEIWVLLYNGRKQKRHKHSLTTTELQEFSEE